MEIDATALMTATISSDSENAARAFAATRKVRRSLTPHVVLSRLNTLPDSLSSQEERQSSTHRGL